MINVSVYQGRLVANPERRMSTNNKVFVIFTLAVPRVDGKTADFFDCIAWDKDAEKIHKYVFQGDGLTVKGRTETKDYVDKSGVKRRGHTLIVEHWEFGPKKKSSMENVTPSAYNLQHRKV